MKEVVAFFICLVLIASFPSQYTLQLVNDSKINKVETIVNTAKEQARQLGYFSPDMINNIKEQIVALGFDESDITIDVTTTPKYRTDVFDDRELIKYDIKVAIEKIIAANKFFGISDEDNRGAYKVSGTVASERLRE
ncbi:MAG: hypothetical protein ACK5MV_03985 [Aminipila sp.]